MGELVVLPSLLLDGCIFGPMLSFFHLVTVEGAQVLKTAVRWVPKAGVRIPLITSPSWTTAHRRFKQLLAKASALVHMKLNFPPYVSGNKSARECRISTEFRYSRRYVRERYSPHTPPLFLCKTIAIGEDWVTFALV